MPQNLVRSSVAPKLTTKRASATVTDYSPDDLVIVQKRQSWRLRVAQICIEHFEISDPAVLTSSRRPLPELEKLAGSYARISDYVKRDLAELLATGVSVHELEAVRYQANYFLEDLVRHLRESIHGRHRAKRPLQDASQEEIETVVLAALAEQSDALCVFVEDVVKLAQFELEVESQRERIRLLLGGDRRLAGLGNNETILKAPLAELWRAVRDFTSVSSYLKENLPPLLEKASPYPALEKELSDARAQLKLLRERIAPFETRLAYKQAQDRRLAELEQKLEDSSSRAVTLAQERLAPMLQRAKSPHEDPITAPELNALHGELRRLGEKLRQIPSGVVLADSPFTAGEQGESSITDLKALNGHLEMIEAEVPALRQTALAGRGEESSVPEPPVLHDMLVEVDARVEGLRRLLERAVPDLRSFREGRTRHLREHFCSVLGEFRTFLQTSFAHIASKDPRSTESSYHFFLREFSNEAQQAILLLSEIRALENMIHRLQGIKIAGLPLNPDNLARILRVLFVDKDEETRRIPSGEGWKLMSSFLAELRDELVPRLQRVCTLDGIRYEDKNFLSEWAMDLARNCTLCLAEHQIGYGLLQEMGRLRDDPEAAEARQSYVHIVTSRTCKAMRKSLSEICMTLTASIPYVGIMRGGVERRASIFFHRQQKLLESGSEPASRPLPRGDEKVL